VAPALLANCKARLKVLQMLSTINLALPPSNMSLGGVAQEMTSDIESVTIRHVSVTTSIESIMISIESVTTSILSLTTSPVMLLPLVLQCIPSGLLSVGKRYGPNKVFRQLQSPSTAGYDDLCASDQWPRR
jgi:hypothetical protein